MATRRLAWLAVALAGLLAVIGIASRAPRPLGVGGTTGVGPGFFDYAFTTFVLVLAAELVLLVLALALHVRRDGKFEPPQRAWWKQVAVLTAVVLLATLITRIHPVHPHTPGGAAKPGSAAAEREKTARRVHGRNVRLRWEELAIGGAVLAVLLAAGLAAERRLRRRGPGDPDEPPAAAAEISTALDDALDDLRSSSDFRRAVIAAYARMETALAVHGLPRRRSEAPLEYLERALVRLQASQGSVRRLTDLFEWAKFSQHEVDAPMRDAAVHAFVDVRDELRAAT